jgi:WD40 repeat protein
MNSIKLRIVPTVIATVTLCGGCLSMSVDEAEWPVSRSMTDGSPSVISIAFSDDGQRAVTSHYWVHPKGERVHRLFYPDGVMRIWERQPESSFRDDRLLASRTFPEMWPYRVRFPPDSTTLQLVLRRNESQLVTCDSDTLQWLVEPLPLAVSVVSPDGRYFAGEVGEVDLLPIFDSAVSPGSQHSTGEDTDVAATGVVVLTDQKSNVQIVLRSDGRSHSAIEFSRDGELLLTGSDLFPDGPTKLSIWKTSSGKRLCQIEDQSVSTSFPAPVFSTDSRMIAFATYSASHDMSMVRIHLASDGSFVRDLVFDDGNFWAIAFSPDGTHLAVSGERSGVGESGFVRRCSICELVAA